MITLSSLDNLNAISVTLEKFQKDYPILFEKLLDMINLTRAFQFKYQYMGYLIMDEDPCQCAPNYVSSSVLRLYRKELQALKDDPDFQVLKKTFSEFRNTGYANISQLVLGMKPESLVGTSSIR